MFVLTALLAASVAGCRRDRGNVVKQLLEPDTVLSQRRTFVSGVVTRRCLLVEKPVNGKPIELHRGTSGAPIGFAETGPDGRFTLRSEFLASLSGAFYLKVEDLWMRLPDKPDGTYVATIRLDCDDVPVSPPHFDPEGIRIRPREAPKNAADTR